MQVLSQINSIPKTTVNSFNYSRNSNAVQPVLKNNKNSNLPADTNSGSDNNDFWQNLKQIFVQGILEKALLSYTFWEMTHGKIKLPKAVLIPLSALAGIGIGSLFIKLEHFIDKTVCKLLNSPDEDDDSKNDNKCKHQIFPWSPSAFLAKSISLFLILSLIIGKKIFLISQFKADNDFATYISKATSYLAIAAKLPENKIKELNEMSKNKEISLADHLDNQANFALENFNNPFAKVVALKTKYIAGIPSFTTAQRNIYGEVKLGNVARDAGLKMLFLLPIGLAFKAFTDIIHQEQASQTDD